MKRFFETKKGIKYFDLLIISEKNLFLILNCFDKREFIWYTLDKTATATVLIEML